MTFYEEEENFQPQSLVLYVAAAKSFLPAELIGQIAHSVLIYVQRQFWNKSWPNQLLLLESNLELLLVALENKSLAKQQQQRPDTFLYFQSH